MNRQYKRMMKKEEDRKKTAPRPVKAPRADTKRERTKPRQFLKEVVAELRKVAWPTRAEVANFSVVVFVALVLLTGLIFGLDYLFGKAVIYLFES